MKLAGKTAIVTGGTRGLGRAIVEAFLCEGANVCVLSRTNSARDQELIMDAMTRRPIAGQKLIYWDAFDVADPETVVDFFDKFLNEHGPMDILVNNAGTHGFIGELEYANTFPSHWKQWRRAIKTNLYGPALMMTDAITIMKEHGGGKIINISGGGATKPMSGMSAYAASKAALVRLTETVALELKGTGIDVNAVAPGVLNTRMLNQQIAAGPDKIGREYYDSLVKQKAEGLSFERATALCAWLASSDSDGVTGRLISAHWDDWEYSGFKAILNEQPDLYTLRRKED